MLAQLVPERGHSQTSDEYTSINTSKGEKTISEEQKDSREESSSQMASIKKEFKNFTQKDEDVSFQKGSTKSKRNFIEKHAFITSKFQKNLASKRCDALLDYKLVTSFQVSISKVTLTWNHKYSMSSDQPPASLSTTPSLKELPLQAPLPSSLSSQNLLKLPSNSPADSLSFVITTQGLFFGVQKWELASTDTSISQHDVAIGQIYSFVHPHVQITKVGIGSLSIFTQLGHEQHPFLTSGPQDRFLEFYLWNKR